MRLKGDSQEEIDSFILEKFGTTEQNKKPIQQAGEKKHGHNSLRKGDRYR